jgi:ribosomal protein S14
VIGENPPKKMLTRTPSLYDDRRHLECQRTTRVKTLFLKFYSSREIARENQTKIPGAEGLVGFGWTSIARDTLDDDEDTTTTGV